MQTLKQSNDLIFKTYRGEEISQIIEPLAQLRMKVFYEYPYLYDGNLDGEQQYLGRYLKIKDSFVLMVFSGSQVIGATTATPLIEESEEFRAPYEKAGINIPETFYFGEAMLNKEYRGMGIYKTFMFERMQVAKQYGATICTFISVRRQGNHHLKPKDYQDLKPIWHHYGFKEHPEIESKLQWKDIDKEQEDEKLFSAWIKTI